MKRFGYAIAADFAAAAEALSKAPNSVAKAGGTDLLDLLKERIYEPDETVHIGQARNDLPAGELNALATLVQRGLLQSFAVWSTSIRQLKETQRS